MASYTPCQPPLPLLCESWFASLTGPPSTILSSQKLLLRTILAVSPSPVSEKISTVLFLNVGLLYAFQGSLALATASFEEAIARSPHCTLAHFGLGLTNFLQANNFHAIQAWKGCVASFEAVTPEDNQGAEYIGADDILYRMWQSSRYEEDQQNRQGEVKQEENDKLQQWLLNKEVVLWNISVAERRWTETMNAVYHPGLYANLDENPSMLSIKGIPAGMLFGPPSELRQEVHMQSKEGSERYQKGPTEGTDLVRANGRANAQLSSRAGSFAASTEVASASISESIPPRRGKDHFVPNISSSSTLPATTDGHHLTSINSREQSSALFQGDIQTEYPKRSADTITIRRAATSTMGNRQAALLPSPPSSRPNSRTRILESATPSSVLEPKKPLPPLPGRLHNVSNLTSRYTLRDPQTGVSNPTSRYTGVSSPASRYTLRAPQTGASNSTSTYTLLVPQAKPKYTATRTTLSATASSLTRFFTKSKRGEPKSSTAIDASAEAGVGASVSNPTSHSAAPGATSNTRAPFGGDKQGKSKGSKGSYVPKHWYPFPPGHKDHQTYAEFEEAMRESERERPSRKVDLSVKTEWEKRMEANVAAEMKTSKRLYFPPEVIKVTPQVKHGLGSGRGLSYDEGSEVETIPLQTQDHSPPAPLPIARTGTRMAAESDPGSSNGSIPRNDEARGLNLKHQISLGTGVANPAISSKKATSGTKRVPSSRIGIANNVSSSATASVLVWPERSASLITTGLSSSAPSYPPPRPPPRQREQRGKSKSRSNPEPKWDDEGRDPTVKKEVEKGKFKVENQLAHEHDDEAPHGSGGAGRNADDAEEEPDEYLNVLTPVTFQGFGGGIRGQWRGGKWI